MQLRRRHAERIAAPAFSPKGVRVSAMRKGSVEKRRDVRLSQVYWTHGNLHLFGRSAGTVHDSLSSVTAREAHTLPEG